MIQGMTSAQMPSAYNAADVEQRIYQSWQSNGYFDAKIIEGQEPYVIIMPPPNVPGELHLGLSLIHIAEHTRRTPSSYAVIGLKKK